MRMLLPVIGMLIACHKDTRAEVADAAATQFSPFGPTHSRTGDPYALADDPQVTKGILRVPIVDDDSCEPREFKWEKIAETAHEPRTVAAAIVLDSGGRECRAKNTRILEFDLEEQLGAGCYDTLLLSIANRSMVVPLDRFGCDEKAKKYEYVETEYQKRWGDAYRLIDEPRLENGAIRATARYNGGCARHDWDVQFREYRTGRGLQVAVADLWHDAHDDRCDVLETTDIEIDIHPWLGDSCPDLVELHAPDTLPTGDIFDHLYLIDVKAKEDCRNAISR